MPSLMGEYENKLFLIVFFCYFLRQGVFALTFDVQYATRHMLQHFLPLAYECLTFEEY